MAHVAAQEGFWARMGLRLSWLPLLLAGLLLVAIIVPRFLWDQFLDPFEDGYHNWWIASVLVQTGQYADPYSLMTQGNWLPGYHLVVAGMISALGSHIMPILKLTNIAFSLGTSAVVYSLARPRGRHVAVLAAFLFALNPTDIVISSFATPEALALLATFAGVLVLERKSVRGIRSLALASILFLIAATMRYEVWGFLAIYLLWKWRTKELSARALGFVAGPAVLFVAAWWAWTSQYGFLPAIIVGQTSTDVRYKGLIGALAPAWDRIGAFFGFYLFYTPFVLLAFLWAWTKERRSPFTAVLVIFYAAEVVYTTLNFGNPSPRYIHLTMPIVSIYAASSILSITSWIRSAHVRRPRALAPLPTAVALAVSLVLVAQVLTPSPPPGTLLHGTQRAGIYLSGHPLPAGKLLLSESPITAYYSGYPASRIIGSTLLPDDAVNATAFLVPNVAYLVMVTVPYYRLRTLFPQQANGTNGNHLQLVFDATGPEYSLGAPRVLVFEVTP